MSVLQVGHDFLIRFLLRLGEAVLKREVLKQQPLAPVQV
jgi:hypothetical protein